MQSRSRLPKQCKAWNYVLPKVSKTTSTWLLSNRGSVFLPKQCTALSESNLICAGDWMADSRKISHWAFHLLQGAISKKQKLVIYCITGIAATARNPGFEPGSYCVLQCTNTGQIFWLQRASIYC